MTLKPPTGSDSELLALIEGDVIEYSLVEAGVTFYTTAALADAGTDSTTLIQTAADLCKANSWRLVRGKGAGGEFVKTTNRITFANIDLDLSDVIFRVAMTYPLASEKAAVMCYQSGAQYLDRVSRRTLKLPRVQNVKPSSIARWITAGASVNDIGLQLVNCEGCDILVSEAADFSIGLDTTGDGSAGGAGFVYNTVSIGYLVGNRINHRLGQKSALGWCNSNTFIGGSYSHYDGEGGLGTRQAGVRHISMPLIDTGAYQVNGNCWIGSSFENAASEYDVESFGRESTWFACRWEKAAAPRIRYRAGTVVNSSENRVVYGYNARTIVQSSETNCTRNLILHGQGADQSGLGGLLFSGAFSVDLVDNPLSLKRTAAGPGLGVIKSFITGETNPRFELLNDGTMKWATADAAEHVETYPVGSGIIEVLGIGGAIRTLFRVRGHASQTAGQPFFEGQTSGSVIRWQAMHDGSMVAAEVAADPAAPSNTYGTIYAKDVSGKTIWHTRDSVRVEQLPGSLTGTATWDPASVNAAAQATTTLTVTGAAVGDPVTVGFDKDLQAMQLTGYVSAADTVTVVLRNGTAGAIDLASGTLRAKVTKYT